MNRPSYLLHGFRYILLIIIVTTVFPIKARALFMHTYTGNNYTDLDGDYNTSMSVSGMFTTQYSLALNTWNNPTSDVAFTFSFFDGIQTIDHLNADNIYFKLLTDSDCNIIEWEVRVRILDPSYQSVTIWNVSALGDYYDIGLWQQDPLHCGILQ